MRNTIKSPVISNESSLYVHLQNRMTATSSIRRTKLGPWKLVLVILGFGFLNLIGTVSAQIWCGDFTRSNDPGFGQCAFVGPPVASGTGHTQVQVNGANSDFAQAHFAASNGFRITQSGRTEMPSDTSGTFSQFHATSKVTFMPVNGTDPNAVLNLSIRASFALTDPSGNVSPSNVWTSMGVDVVTGDTDEDLFRGGVNTLLDTSTMLAPDFSRDLFTTSFTRNGDTFFVDLSLDTTIPAAGLNGRELKMNARTEGKIFKADGTNPGNTLPWIVATDDVSTFTVTSSDPNMLFIIPEPSVCALGILAGCVLGGRRRRRSWS